MEMADVTPAIRTAYSFGRSAAEPRELYSTRTSNCRPAIRMENRPAAISTACASNGCPSKLHESVSPPDHSPDHSNVCCSPLMVMKRFIGLNEPGAARPGTYVHPVSTGCPGRHF